MKILKSVCISLLVLCCIHTVRPQDFYNNNVSTDQQELVPSSPEASNLGRFGSIPLNSSTGQMNFSVPIHTIQSGNFSLPISLQYNFSGLILEGKPSLVGLGWSLMANGAVVREVRGLPDEHENGYYSIGGTVKQIIDDYETQGDMSLNNLREKFYKGVYDSEVDKYTVSIGEKYYSFKIDENKEPIFLSDHNDTILINWNSSYTNQIDSFEVIDDRGIKYTFSDEERSIPYQDEELLLNPLTSWNITEIEFPNGENIDFDYAQNDFTSYDFSARGAVLLADVQEDLTNDPVFFSPVYTEFGSQTTIKRKLLTRITFESGSIVFFLSSTSPREIYESIQVKNKFGDVINEYELTYIGDRDELISIDKNNKPFYSFEYYGNISGNSTVPPFMQSVNDKPLAQDRWKFFNSASNSYALNVPSSSYTADLEPDFQSTLKGALKRIYYPTGGYSEIVYEQNQIKTNNVNNGSHYASLPLTKTLKASLQLDGSAYTSQHKEKTVSYTFQNPTVATISHFATTNDIDNTHLVMVMQRTSTCPYDQYYPSAMLPLPPYSAIADYDHLSPYLRQEIQRLNLQGVSSEIPIICPSLAFEWSPAGVGGAPTIEQGHSQGRVLIAPGTYDITLYTDYNGYSEAYGEVVINFNYAQATQEPSPYVNENVGGIRVAQIKDCLDGTNCYSRIFNYNDDDGFSTGILNVVPVREVISSWTTHYYDGSTIDQSFVEMYDYSTNAYTALNPSFGTPVYYERIQEYNSQEKFNGYKETTYKTPLDINGFDYPTIPKSIDLDKGMVNNEKYYKFLSYHPNPVYGDSTAVELIKELKYQHSPFRGLYTTNGLDENLNHPLSFKVVRRQNLDIDFTRFDYDLNPTNPLEINAVKGLYMIVPYKELDLVHKIGQERVFNYYNGQTIETKSDYYYGNDDYKQLRKKVTTDSKGDIVEMHIEYAYDKDSEGNYSDMITANQIVNPAEVIQLKNSDTISRQKTVYKLSGLEFKPEIIFEAKGNNALEPILKYDYDDFGKTTGQLQISHVSPSNPNEHLGARTQYIWGYHRQLPIAKLENIAIDLIPTSTITNLQSLSNLEDDRTIDTVDANGARVYVGDEGVLREALDDLRIQYPHAMITTYTYDPLIGMTSLTDPKGVTTYYNYDNQNRLLSIKDINGNLISDYKYHYKGEN